MGRFHAESGRGLTHNLGVERAYDYRGVQTLTLPVLLPKSLISISHETWPNWGGCFMLPPHLVVGVVKGHTFIMDLPWTGQC